MIFLDNCTQEYKSTKKQIVRVQLNLYPSTSFRCKRKEKKRFLFFKIALGTRLSYAKWVKINGKPDKINELIPRTKADLKDRPDNMQ